MTLLSIIIPSYNRAHLIRKTLDSILEQDYPDFEIIVVDDGSQDDTEAVVSALTDNRLRYYRKENGERGAARNYGAAKASGKYFNFFDSDDLMLGNHLTTAIKMINQYCDPEWFHLAYDYRTEEGQELARCTLAGEELQAAIFFDNRLSCNGIFLRADIARRFHFEEDRRLASSEDWYLWIYLGSRFALKSTEEVTSTVIAHDLRSLNTIAPEKIVTRDLLMIKLLENDDVVRRHYGRRFSKFVAERYTFFMMKFAELGDRRTVWRWGRRALITYFPVIFTKRFLAALKNSL